MKAIMTIAAAAVLAIGSGFLFYSIGLRKGMEMNTSPGITTAGGEAAGIREDPSQWSIAEGEAATRRHIDTGIDAGDIDPVTGREVLHYFDPMMPASKFEAPGKSPYMDMMLVPAYAGGSSMADAGTVTISPRMQQNTGMRTAVVREGTLAPVINATGVITWNERDQAVMQARAAGFVERLHVRATLDTVEAGDPLADLYIPEWVALQEEFLALQKMQGNELEPLNEAVKARMRQAGMTEEQIAEVTTGGQVQPLFTMRSPLAGVISELGIREGMTVTPGMTLFRINGNDTIWAEAEVPESQAAQLQVGDEAIATTPSAPGIRFEGRIQALLPALDPQLRTRKARLELQNPAGRLVPGMVMQMAINAASQQPVLLVPTEAVIDTGARTVVMLAEGGGNFRPVTVTTGLESGGQTAILSGLQAGQSVVASGQFLLDSEASLSGLEARAADATEPRAAMAEEPETHRTSARIDAISPTSVTLSHPPISTLDWPAMTMNFLLPAQGLPAAIDSGDMVEVEFRISAGGEPQITNLVPLQNAASEPGPTP